MLPRIIGRPAEAEQLIIRAGQRAQDVERAAAADIEQFAAEQAAAEGGELAPLLAEAGTQTAAEAAAAEAAGGGILEGLAAAGGAAAEGIGTAAAATFRRRPRHGSGSGHGRRGSPGRRRRLWTVSRRPLVAIRQRRRCGLKLRQRVPRHQDAEQHAAGHAAGALQRAAAHGVAPEQQLSSRSSRGRKCDRAPPRSRECPSA